MLRRSVPRLSLQMLQEPLQMEERTADRGQGTYSRLVSSQTTRVGIAGGLFGAAFLFSAMQSPAEEVKSSSS